MIQKNSEILVKVDEASADLLLVSYFREDKKYQGVLLDTTKSNLPYGVYGLHPAFTKETPSNEDKLHSVSQRYAYQEAQYASDSSFSSRKPSKVKLRQKQKMTVRLRPRKVLCSNCQGICNENSENVHLKRRKIARPDASEPVDIENKFLMGSMLIPKLSRLHPSEITSALKGSKPKTDEFNSETVTKQSFISEHVDDVIHDVAFVNVDDKPDDILDVQEKNEDINFFRSAKTLKICFGEGEGTVVKIPPLGDQNEDSGVCDMTRKTNDSKSKAARRAKRKAKKSKRNSAEKLNLTSNVNVNQKHIGALSPRNNICDSTSNTADKKAKQRVKRSKKHKVNEPMDENTTKPEIDYFIDIKSPANRNSDDNVVGLVSGMDNELAEWEGDTAPDFPVTGREGATETELPVSPGDIVWGKVVGFPWWPGRVLSVTSTAKAHVAWYACTTSSLMPCDSLSPFLEDYKLRYNKRQRGTYKEAVKLATQEAQLFESQLQDPLGSPAHSLEILS